ncbi:MAG: 50S ribosome-binding GTPase [Campylobacter sp.]|nr:50S ribosome-binding GTPase [Campylobacter sp.]
MDEKGIELNFASLAKDGFKAFKKVADELTSDLNVLIVGKTGVGKSTLINAVFGDEVVKVGSGKSITKEITKIEVNKNFNIYDTKGLEMKDFESTFEDIENFLKTMETKPANEQIHVAWFCIAESGRRIEDGEKKLYEILKSNNYATILVITKAQQDKDEKGESFKEIVKREFHISDENDIQRVRALEVEDDDGEKKKIIGVDELIEKTYHKLPNARKQAFTREQKHNKKMKEQEALSIINKYSAAAVAEAATPIPFSDIALILPTQIAMITHLTHLYGLEVNAESIAKLTVTFVGVAGVGFAVRAGVGTFLKLIPGIGSIAGGAFNATVAGSVTKLIGNAYLAYLNDNFELIYKGDFNLLLNFTEAVMKNYVDKAK